MPYTEMTESAVKQYWPELGGNVNIAPLSDLYGVLDIVSACLNRYKGTSYNPAGLDASKFAWAHVRLTGSYGYPTQSQLCAQSLMTQRVMSSDILLAVRNDCQTYMVELTNLSKI